MTKGLWLYTAGLILAAILVLMVTVPHHAVFAGLAVLGTGAAVLAVAMGRDFGSAESRAHHVGNAERED
jgi:hypothetical protein